MGEKYRHELKYLIKRSDAELLKLRLKYLMELDPHAGEDGYMIRSIYFDDYWNSAFNDKEAGILERAKWRIRIYNCSDSSIKLERKKKFGSYIYKEAASLTRDETMRLIDGDYLFLLKKDNELLRQFYVECITKLMKPRVIVDYDRLPFILQEGTVRVTFDSDVRAAVLSNDIFDDALPSISCMVTLAISTNVVISLGMVGALSIVRFRTAIKDPLDLLYLFWAITAGITAGAKMYLLAVSSSIIMLVVIIIFYSRSSSKIVYVAVVHYTGDDTGDKILQELGKFKYCIKSKTLRGQETELAMEISVKKNDLFFEEKIRNLENVKDVTLIQYNGEYHG